MVREKSARWPCSKDCDHQCIGNEKPHNHRAVKLISPNKLAFLVPWVSWPWDMQSRSCYFIICQPIRINKYLIAHSPGSLPSTFWPFFCISITGMYSTSKWPCRTLQVRLFTVRYTFIQNQISGGSAVWCDVNMKNFEQANFVSVFSNMGLKRVI